MPQVSYCEKSNWLVTTGWVTLRSYQFIRNDISAKTFQQLYAGSISIQWTGNKSLIETLSLFSNIMTWSNNTIYTEKGNLTRDTPCEVAW